MDDWCERTNADTLAIDQVLFTQNTSPIPDEMLAHRLGMVPLVSRNVMNGLRYTRVRLNRIAAAMWLCRYYGARTSADNEQDCDCDEGCYYCMVKLRLSVSNRHGQKGTPLAVTSDMLEVVPSPNDVSYLLISGPSPATQTVHSGDTPCPLAPCFAPLSPSLA
jgi:DNA-directed RNA polymerase II subunit RPB3